MAIKGLSAVNNTCFILMRLILCFNSFYANTVNYLPRLIAQTGLCWTRFKPFCNDAAYNMSLVMRKPAFCICKNKDEDQLRGNREADQRLCFRYTDNTVPLLRNSEISSL